MQFTRNKRVIDRYFAYHPTYSNYDVNTVLIMDFMYEKKIPTTSDVIRRLRITHMPVVRIGKNVSIHHMHLLLSVETRVHFVRSQKLWLKDHYKSEVVPRRAVVKLRKRRCFYRNSILFGRGIPCFNPKHLNKKVIWLKKHKLI